MKAILSISSQTVYGHVGNSASQFILQRLGFEVWAIPTVLLSNHPGHATPARTVLSSIDILGNVRKLAEHGWLKSCVAIHSGYLADHTHAETIAEIVHIVKHENPDAIYVCDPILGDSDKGLYIPASIAETIKSHLVPIADILTPNAFELSYLTDQEIVDTDHALIARQRLAAPIVLCTSITKSSGKIATAVMTTNKAHLVETPYIDNAPKGTGDTLAALFLAETLKGADIKRALRYSVGATYELCLRSVAKSADELLLIEEQDALLNPVKLQVSDVG